MSRTIMVTGADGFIGSHLTEKLILKGYNVKAFVFYNSNNSWGWLDHSKKEIKKNLDVFSGDIRDIDCVKHAMHSCDAVLHLASLISIPYSYISPVSYIQTNALGTLNVLQAARDLQLSKIVHTSTSEVYGSAQYVPINEAHPLVGQSPYSASKIAADQLAFSFFSSYDLPVITLRPFNTYGPRQSARAVIPSVISQISSGKDKIFMGSTFPTRDFNFVSDIVDGFISALESEVGFGDVFNLGSNFEISINDAVNLIAKTMNQEIEIINDEKRERPINSEVNRLFSDNSKALKILKWKPQFTGLKGFEKGLIKTISWFNDPRNLELYKTEIYNV